MSDFDIQSFEDNSELEQPEEINPADIRFSAMNFLARREHSYRELKQKLKKRFPSDELIELELQRLADENLQNDARFAEAFVRQRTNSGYGPVRTRQELRERGILDAAISDAIECIGIDWPSVADEAYRKKYGEMPAIDLKEKAKRSRFMQYRGFAPEHYGSLLK